jgi:hypothetical protein
VLVSGEPADRDGVEAGVLPGAVVVPPAVVGGTVADPVVAGACVSSDGTSAVEGLPAGADDGPGAVPDDDGDPDPPGRPSRPMTTGDSTSRDAADVDDESSCTAGERPPTPEMTGIASTTTTTVVVTTTPNVSRPRRARTVARRRADSGGREKRWCTRGPRGSRIVIARETNCMRRVTDSPWHNK